jgi:polyphenol oxidase
VGQDLLDRFVALEPNTIRFFKPAQRPDHWMFDLGGYVVSRLRRAKVGEIEDLGHCTYADPSQFYSYRRSTHRAEADYGRHINAIALAD